MLKSFVRAHKSSFDLLIRIVDPILVVVSTFAVSSYGPWRDTPDLIRVFSIYSPILIVILFPFFSLYRSWRGIALIKELQQLLFAWLVVLVAFNVLIFLLASKEQLVVLWPFGLFMVSQFCLWALVVFIVLAGYRIVLRLLLKMIRVKGYDLKHVVIVGAGKVGEKVAQTLMQNSWMGYVCLGFVDDDEAKKGQKVANLPILGTTDDLVDFVRVNPVDVVFIAIPLRYGKKVEELYSLLNEFSCDIKFVPDVFASFVLGSARSDIANLPVISMNSITKRWTDVFVAFVLILILSPFFCFIPLLIRVLEGYPIFYKSQRLVKQNKFVTVYKFRSMVRDATHPKYKLNELYMKDGYLDIPLEAAVYTPVGRFLEITQLVEIPQLFNILLGEMSFIGNRPLPRKNVELLKDQEGWHERFFSPAGLSGISQVVGKHDLRPIDRLRLERYYSSVYLQGQILRCDMYIIYRTILLILFRMPLSYEKAEKFLVRCGGQIS